MTFVEKNRAELQYLEKTFADAVRSIDDRVQWKSERLPSLLAWLQQNMYKTKEFRHYVNKTGQMPKKNDFTRT